MRTAEDLAPTAFIFSCIFSHTRGTPKKAVGRTSFMVFGSEPWEGGGTRAGTLFLRTDAGVCEDSLCSHLQRVGLGEVGEPAHSHGDPDVHHLGSDVAQREVADHHFLRHAGV